MFAGFDFYQISTFVVPVLLGITLHEAAHGWVAWKLGDNTAHAQGRVTFNPFRHIDPMGTVILPALLVLIRAPFVFGWAKPVPVRFSNLRRPTRDMVLVAAAGPCANFVLALGAGVLLHFAPLAPAGAEPWVTATLRAGIFVNLLLAIFNMIPIPPLDGGRVAVGLLPHPLDRALARTERYGFFILLGVLLILPMVTRRLGSDFGVFESIILPLVAALYNVVFTLTGHI